MASSSSDESEAEQSLREDVREFEEAVDEMQADNPEAAEEGNPGNDQPGDNHGNDQPGDNQAVNNRPARGVKSGGGAKGRTGASGSLTVMVAVKERLHALKWTIENIIQKSGSSGSPWPWSSNGSVNKRLVVVQSAHVHPLLSCIISNKYASQVRQGLTAGAHEIRTELEKNFNYNPVVQDVKEECKRQKVKATIVETIGDPRLTLFKAVEKHKADILVLGGHNYNEIRRLLLGSVADTFVDYCRSKLLKCRLVVVHHKRGKAHPFFSVHSPF